MSSAEQDRKDLQNPLDTIEDMVVAQEWPYHRLSYDEILLEIAGRWLDYRLSFFWNEDPHILQCLVFLDMPVPAARLEETIRLLHMVNLKMGMGHFELSAEENLPVFRYAYLMAGQRTLKPESFEELLEIAISECERFYPAFQMSILGEKKAEEALSLALLDPQGEA